MKSRTIFAVVLAVLISSIAAFAQSPVLTANIPFQFYVGEKLMPAGNYTIRLSNDNAMILMLDNSHLAKAIITHNAERSTMLTEPVLVFRHLGDTHFLFQLWREDYSTGRELSATKRQQELARNGEPDSRTVILLAKK